jgi:hypothetical protein
MRYTTRLRFVPLLLWVLLFIGFSCDKDKPDTILRGRILDAETLEPIDGVYISYLNIVGQGPVDPIYDPGYIYSDSNGRFEIIFSDKGGRIETIIKKPYLTYIKGVALKKSQINEVDFFLIPQHGLLKLIIKNKYGVNNAIYVDVTNDILEAEYFGQGRAIDKCPLIQPINSEYTETFYMVSDIYARIKWRYNMSGPKIIDSIYIVKNDTTTFNIAY